MVNAFISGDDAALAKSLEEAVAGSLLTPAFQPLVHLQDGAIEAFEVLARWNDDRLGNVPPTVFIPIAERLGLIASLTRGIISKACTAAVQWDGDFSLALNVSPLHFQDDALPSLFENAVSRTGFSIDRTVIEITESAVFENEKAARATLDMFRAKGVKVALDDFGTGYSSLTRLQALPFDQIKIDASFVRAMVENRDSRKIVSAVIGLGQSLGLSVVAEGVETTVQANLLRQLGCDFGQGWLFGRPLPASEVSALIAERGLQSRMPHHLNLSTNQRLAQLEAVYGAAPVAMCFIDPQFRLLNANRRYCALLGLPREKIVGREIAEVVPWAFPYIQAAMSRAMCQQPIESREHEVPGTRRLCRTFMEASHDENGEFLGISVAIVDVSMPNFVAYTMHHGIAGRVGDEGQSDQIPLIADANGIACQAALLEGSFEDPYGEELRRVSSQ